MGAPPTLFMEYGTLYLYLCSPSPRKCKHIPESVTHLFVFAARCGQALFSEITSVQSSSPKSTSLWLWSICLCRPDPCQIQGVYWVCMKPSPMGWSCAVLAVGLSLWTYGDGIIMQFEVDSFQGHRPDVNQLINAPNTHAYYFSNTIDFWRPRPLLTAVHASMIKDKPQHSTKHTHDII